MLCFVFMPSFFSFQESVAASIANANPKKDGKEVKARQELKDKLDKALKDLNEVQRLKILYALAKKE